MVICLQLGADLHMAQLMPLPLTVSCFSIIQIGFTFLVLAHPGSPGKGPLNGCVCVLCSKKLCSFWEAGRRHPQILGMFLYLFIYLLKNTYETNKANDITVGQKGT